MGRDKDERTADRAGDRYALGSVGDEYAIWERRGKQRPPLATFPHTEEGWASACQTFGGLEPNSQPVAADPAASRAPFRRILPGIAGGAVATVAIILLLVGARHHSNHRRAGSVADISNTDTSPPHTPTTVEPTTGTGYLATGAGWVDFIQWNDSGGAIAGTAQAAYSIGDPPNFQVSSVTYTVTGTRDGSKLTLSFNKNPFAFGTIDGDEFTMNFPQQGGMLAPVTFKKASVDDFNQAVASLNGNVNQANATKNAADDEAKRRAAVDSAAADVARAIETLGGETQALNGDVAATLTDLQDQAKDLTTTQVAAQKAEADARAHPDGNAGEVCAAVSEVEAAASGVEAGASGVGAGASGVESELGTVRKRISSLQSAFGAYQIAAGQAPGYTPSRPASSSAVNQAVASANGAIAAAVGTTNGYIDKANQATNTAYGYAADADRAGHCGPPSQPGAPLSHIS